MIVITEDDHSISMDTPAKVNLYLHVLGRRADGYHDIDSVFQAVSLYDRLTLTRRDRAGMDLSVEGNGLPCDESNLIVQAFRVVDRHCSLEGGVDAIVVKRVPIAAGLGGGSSDAAGTIFALNSLFDLGLDARSMARIGAEIGSDVPFFFSGGQARVGGRGEIVESTDLPLDYSLALVTPALSISTAAAYSDLKMGLTETMAPFNLPRCRSAGELWTSLGHSGNDFERVQVSAHPVLAEVRQALANSGARLVRMSGSGPTVCGFFDNKPPVELSVLSAREGWQLYVVKPIKYNIKV